MNLEFSSLYTLVPEPPSCLVYKLRCQVYEGFTQMPCFLMVHWFNTLHICTTYTTHTRTNKLTYRCKYLCHLLCTHSSYLYNIEWSNWNKKITLHSRFAMSLFLKNYWLADILDWIDKTKSFFIKHKKKTVESSVNEQNTHRKIILVLPWILHIKCFSMKISRHHFKGGVSLK